MSTIIIITPKPPPPPTGKVVTSITADPKVYVLGFISKAKRESIRAKAVQAFKEG